MTQDNDSIQKKALTTVQIEEIYGLNRGTLANLRCQKLGPRYYKLGKTVLYKVEDLEAWLFSNPVQTIDSHSQR